jgi:hypothetical protein
MGIEKYEKELRGIPHLRLLGKPAVGCLEVTSPRGRGIVKVGCTRVETEGLGSLRGNGKEGRVGRSRTPGKITKNPRSGEFPYPRLLQF